jgi:predicted Zn-dependent protease
VGSKFLLFSLIAVIASFAGGFLIANALNRSEMNALRLENERLKIESTESFEGKGETSISDNEIKDKIAEADQNPANFDFQKNLGLALYKYASMKQDTELLKESVRILTRADGLGKDDSEVAIGLGNACFDLGYFGKNNEELIKSREYYNRVLAEQPNDAEVRTDLGLTYFLIDPPDDEKAVAEFQRSLKSDPKHEKTLDFIIQALIRLNRVRDAENYLSQLRAVDPSSESITGLTAKIEEARASQPK